MARTVACTGGLGTSLQDGLRDDGQGPFRSDDELREVVARDVLHGAAARMEDLSSRQDDLEAEDILPRHAVLERARAAGALRDVPADRACAQALRVRRIEEAARLDRLLQIAGDDVRFDDRQQVRLVDLEDAVEPVERENDAARPGHGAAHVAGAAAARRERRAGFIAEPRDRRHFVHVARQDHRLRQPAALQRVRSVEEPELLVHPHELRADNGSQRFEGEGHSPADCPTTSLCQRTCERAKRISRVAPSRRLSSEVA